MWFSKLQSRFRKSATDKSTKYSEEKSLRDLEAKMAYRFKDFNLLRLALTHPSYNIKNPANPNNQASGVSRRFHPRSRFVRKVI